MSTLTPLETLYEVPHGDELPLPAELANLYGHLQFPLHPDRAYVIGNFVSTVDGVVALNASASGGGGEISGFNKHDQMVMGLLRATADAVIVGAGTLRSVPRHLWTASYIYRPLAGAYRQLRTLLGKTGLPLNVIVTMRGNVDLHLPVFQSNEVVALIVTTSQGAARIKEQDAPRSTHIEVVGDSGPISAQAVLEAVERIYAKGMILVEGGPQLMGDFLAERLLDELFLTLAPQIAGRDEAASRPGLVMGKRFAPEHPLWGDLLSVKRGGSHLFLRYAFETGQHALDPECSEG